jgi:hypothetical protein
MAIYRKVNPKLLSDRSALIDVVPNLPVKYVPPKKFKPKDVDVFTKVGRTAKSVVKKGIKFGVAGAALTGLGYLATEPSREYNMGPKTYEPRDLRKTVIYSGLEDI